MLARLIGEDVTVVLHLRAELGARRGRSRADRAGRDEPRGERARRDAGGRDADDRDRQRRPRRAKRSDASGVKPGRYVVLTVTDTGTGMTPEMQARLFEPFFTTKGTGKGTGLGLATVYGIVARSGGSVEVSSEVGKGSSFTVSFPRAAAVEMDVGPSAGFPVRGAAPRPCSWLKTRPRFARWRRRMLNRLGYTVLVAANANEALRLFEHNRSIDVLLTDVVMPGASGPELTRQLVAQRPSAQGDLHVRLHGGRHRPPRGPAAWGRAPAQAVHL